MSLRHAVPVTRVWTCWRLLKSKATAVSDGAAAWLGGTALALGTSSSWVVDGPRRMLEVPSCLAHKGRQVLSGNEAACLEGMTGGGLRLWHPFGAGRIEDRRAGELLVRELLRRAHRWNRRVILAVPGDLTAAERRTVQQVVSTGGARIAACVDEAVMAGLGAGLRVMAPDACLVLDAGASTTRLSAIAAGVVVQTVAMPGGGSELSRSIVEYLRSHRRLRVGAAMAERVKATVGSALPLVETRRMAVDGIALDSGLPARIEVTSTEIHEALQPQLMRLGEQVCGALDELSAAVLADASQQQAVLVGGGAGLAGLDDFLAATTALHWQVPPHPQQCVAMGLQRLLRERALRRRLLQTPPPALKMPARARALPSSSLAWALGTLALVLLWQMIGPLLARSSALDDTLTSLMVPAWRVMARIQPHGPDGLLATDPSQRELRQGLRQSQQQIEALSAENHHLRRLLHMRRSNPHIASTMAGQVVGRDPLAWLQTLVVDVGRRSHAAPGMAVISENGLVGHLADVFASSARVQTITSHGAVTAALVHARHAAGVVYGVDGRSCEMRYLDPNAGVKAGDLVVTSGEDRYPAGLAVGRVVAVRRSTDGVSVTAELRPAVALDTVQDVLVVGGKK